MERLRSLAVVVAAAVGLLGIGLVGTGERIDGPRGFALADASGAPPDPGRVGSARRCDAPRDGFCPIGGALSRAGRGDGSGR